VSSPELDAAEVAAILCRKAKGDAMVVRKLSADREVDDESIGFHAQQAVEKWLKAVVASPRGDVCAHRRGSLVGNVRGWPKLGPPPGLRPTDPDINRLLNLGRFLAADGP
jgi:hypothetical protein